MAREPRRQQRRVRLRRRDADIRHDPAFALLHTHQLAKLRWPMALAAAQDLHPGLEDADELATAARVVSEEPGPCLAHDLAHTFEHDLEGVASRATRPRACSESWLI